MMNTHQFDRKNLDLEEKYGISGHMRTTIGLILIASFVLKLLSRTFYQAFVWDLNSYGYSEFLINYQGGFVRRGLLGELLFKIYQAINFPLKESIFCMSYIVFFGVVLFFFKQFKSHKICWWLLLSSLFLNFSTFIVRKDYLLYALLIVMVYLLRPSSHDIPKKIGACVILIFSLLIHEAFLFWGFVLYTMILVTDREHNWLNYILVLIPLAVVAIIIFFKGTTEIAKAIVDSWNAVIPTHPLVLIHGNSIGAIGWHTLPTFLFHLKYNLSAAVGGGGIILIPLLLLASYYLFSNYMMFFSEGTVEIRNTRRQEISLLYSLFCITLIPLLTVLSCDIGRIFQYATITTFTAFLILPQQRVFSLFPKWYKSVVYKFNEWLDINFPPTKVSIIFLLLILGVSPAGFNLDASWCDSVIGSFVTICYNNGIKLAKLIFF